jgi:hypothetical protein
MLCVLYKPCLVFKIWGFHGVAIKNVVLLDVTPRDSCKNRRFGGTDDGGDKFLRNVGFYKRHTA